MADEVDVGNENAEKEMHNLEKFIRSKANTLEADSTGNCLFCDATLIVLGMRWCNADCRNDWARLNKPTKLTY